MKELLSFNSKLCQITYHSKVPLQGQEEVGLLEVLVSIHISGKKKWLLKGFGNITQMPQLKVSDCGIPRDGGAI